MYSFKVSQPKAKFDYDPIRLIKLVEQRPSIWNKHADEYKNKGYKNSCWTEVYRGLETNYDSMYELEKLRVAEAINEKWRNIRDAFVRSLRKSVNKKYLYFEPLQFLMKTLDKEETIPNMDTDESHTTASDQDQDDTFIETTKSIKRRRRAPTHEDVDFTEDPLAVPSISMLQPTNEDEAFFASVMPFVSGFNEDEKLEFRLEVLQVIQRIKQRRKLSSVEQTISSSSGSNRQLTESDSLINLTSSTNVKEENLTEIA